MIGAWVLIVLCALPFAPQAPGALQAGGFDLPTLESARSRAALESELGAPPSALVLAISSSTLTPGTPQFEAAAQRAVAGVANAPHVVGSRSHLIAPTQVNVEKKIVYDVILLDLKPDDSPAALEGIQAALVEVDGIKVALAGGPSFYADIQIVSETDLQRSELISLPLAAIVLLLVFGSAVAAGLPVLAVAPRARARCATSRSWPAWTESCATLAASLLSEVTPRSARPQQQSLSWRFEAPFPLCAM